MHKLLFILFLFVCWISSNNALFSQNQNLFQQDELLELELHFDINKLLNDRGEDRTRHKADVIFYDADSVKHELNVDIRVRGNFRRNVANCEFPPYSLYFKNSNSENTIFENQNKIKFVTHCNGGTMVLEEYLIYKVYQEVSPNAFQVRLANINYVDYSGDFMTFNQFGFLLENTKKMGKRLNGKIAKPDSILYKNLDEKTIAIISLFNYMVGNTDWDLSLQKNFKYLKKNDFYYIPIEYDFDLAEVINYHYPTFEVVFGVDPEERRRFKCIEIDKKLFFEVVELYKNKKTDIYNIYLNFPYISNTKKVEILNYYEEFFVKLNRKRKLYRELKRACNK